MKIISNLSIITMSLVILSGVASAKKCGYTDPHACIKDGYGIVETEPNVYWPHNQMSAAHWVEHHYQHKKIHHKRRSRCGHSRRSAR